MKKLFYILLLVPAFLIAQNRPDWEYDFQQPISTDFPDKLPYYNDYLPLQNTYYELNITLNNVRKLVKDQLKMNFKENAPSDVGFQYEIYTNPTHRSSLKVKYNTFMVYGLEVVKSIEINGDFADVAKLFIYMYNTDFSTNETPVNQATKHYKQDYTVFTVLPSGKASLTITNTKYENNTEAFLKDFEVSKEKFKNGLTAAKSMASKNEIEAELEAKKRKAQFTTDSIARKESDKLTIIEFQKQESAKPKTTINVYYFKKSSNKLQFKNLPSDELVQLINEKVSDYKKGEYSAYVTTTSILDKKTYEIKINQNQ